MMEPWDKVAACIVLVLIGLSIMSLLPGCATYRGLQQDTHRLTNPNWR